MMRRCVRGGCYIAFSMKRAIAIAAIVAAFLLGFCNRQKKVEQVNRVVRDTIVIRDVRVDTVYRERIVYRALPAVEIVKNDTIVLLDTVYVAIPIDTYVAKDSLYYVEATGYDVRFKRIEVYPTTKYHTQTIYQPRRVSVGLQAGYGASKQGLSPYIGVGIQYNLFSFNF